MILFCFNIILIWNDSVKNGTEVTLNLASNLNEVLMMKQFSTQVITN